MQVEPALKVPSTQSNHIRRHRHRRRPARPVLRPASRLARCRGDGDREGSRRPARIRGQCGRRAAPRPRCRRDSFVGGVARTRTASRVWWTTIAVSNTTARSRWRRTRRNSPLLRRRAAGAAGARLRSRGTDRPDRSFAGVGAGDRGALRGWDRPRADGAANPTAPRSHSSARPKALAHSFVEGERVTSLARTGRRWRVVTASGGRWEAPVVVNAAGAWVDRIAALLGEPVPLEVWALMLMISAPVPHFLDPVIGAAGRPLSFKQYANGTVLIGGGHKGRARRDDNLTDLDIAALLRAVRGRCRRCSRSCARRRSSAAGLGSRKAPARRHSGHRAKFDRGGRVPRFRLRRPWLPAWTGRRRHPGGVGNHRENQSAHHPFRIDRFGGTAR